MRIEDLKNVKEIDNSGYYVDIEGNVYSTHFRKGHETKKMTPNILPNGYCSIRYGNKSAYIHRLVAKAFIPNPENKPEVNHKDLNKQNNHVDNLEWATRKENENHLKDNNPCTGKTGSNSGILYHGYEEIAHFRSLQQAKLYCREHYHCSLSTTKNINACYKMNLFYIRDNSALDIYTVIEQHNKKIKENIVANSKNNKETKGLKGFLYLNGIFVKEFLSIREAIKYCGHDIKYRKNGNYNNNYGYEYKVKCND